MKEERIYKILLSLSELWSIYNGIGDTIVSRIDLNNLSYNKVALNNSLRLLEATQLVSISDDYLEKLVINDEDTFYKELKIRIIKFCDSIVNEILSSEKHYEVNSGEVFIYRNDIPLAYSGLLNLLGELEIVKLVSNRIYIVDWKNRTLRNKEHKRKISIEELEGKLIIQKEIGEAAEKAVIEYENIKLRRLGIDFNVIQISHIDAAAGFDLLSKNKDLSDKYIEVKSCDTTMTFYLSKNEIETAKTHGDHYYLYLYNRSNGEIYEYRNPYKSVFQNKEWAIESQIYKLHRI